MNIMIISTGVVIEVIKVIRRLTERIWLRAFGTPPKFPFGKLQIRSKRYRKWVLGDGIDE